MYVIYIVSVESVPLLIGPIVTDEQCFNIRSRSIEWKYYQKDQYNDADHIIDNIYLGNICAAHNLTWLIEKNISYICLREL